MNRRVDRVKDPLVEVMHLLYLRLTNGPDKRKRRIEYDTHVPRITYIFAGVT